MDHGMSRRHLFSWRPPRLRTLETRLVGMLLLLFMPGLFGFTVSGQTQRCWITFRDRGSSVQPSLADAKRLGISDHALWRRSKVLPPDRLIDDLDLPVNPSYLEQLRSAGIVIRSTSRWFNAVSAELNPAQQASLSNYPFVANVKPVAVFFRRVQETTSPQFSKESIVTTPTAQIDYGQSFSQLNLLRVIDVHSEGVTGAGVIIGMLDDGFNQHTVQAALRNIKVIAEYDFVQQDSNTSRAPGEYITEGNHGAATLSVIGGFDNGKLIGVAFGASFILAKTEIDRTEIRLEEDLYVAGLEWEERLGADIVSSSLGYDIFTDGSGYAYQDMNGVTATTTKAARIAARKGVLLVTAMGNEGNYRDVTTRATGTLITPADADSIVSVGAVNSAGQLAGFSSTGPTADGRVKPEVVAQGVSVWIMYGENGYVSGNGTSFATPLTAGVAALVLSAHPTLTPLQVRDRLTTTAKALYDSSVGMVSHPNNFYGWGMVDALNAVGKLSAAGGPTPVSNQFVLRISYPNPFSNAMTIQVEAPGEQDIDVAIYNLLGQRVRTLYRGKSQAGTNYFQWLSGLTDAGVQVASGIYFCRLITSESALTQRILYVK